MKECERKNKKFNECTMKQPRGYVLKTLNSEEEAHLNKKMKILEDAYNSDVIWDEITELKILPDPHEYVYDFTVPGLESFMIDTGILVGPRIFN